MTRIRVGTRGSDLALAQTRWVCDQLSAVDPLVAFEIVICQTEGDKLALNESEGSLPLGAFSKNVERDIESGEVDFAVHSYKDLPTAPTLGLVIAAVPQREVPHDVLITRAQVELHSLPPGFRVGTGSPRRAAQLRRLADVDIVSIRGNVPTRIARVENGELDAVVIAAAGIRRLGRRVPNKIELPIDDFLPAPAQGALAIQTSAKSAWIPLLRRMEHRESRLAVDAERAFLHLFQAGCQQAIGAWAMVQDSVIQLKGEFFSPDGRTWARGTETGIDSTQVGIELARRLAREMQGKPQPK